LRAIWRMMPAERTRAPRLSRDKHAAFKECNDSPQRCRVRRGAKAPRPQTDLYEPWAPVGVGARLRATWRMMPAERARAPRLSREKHAAFKECNDSPQRCRVRRGAKAPRPQTDLYEPWAPVGVGARLRATWRMMPAERTRAPRLSREKHAAFKECNDSPQRCRVRRGAKAPRPQTDLYEPWAPVGVGARLRATWRMMPAERTRAPRLSRDKHAAFKECNDSPQRCRVRRGAKAPRPQTDLYEPWAPVGVGARLRATWRMMPAERTRAPRLSRDKHAAFKECNDSPQRCRVRRGAKAPRPQTDLYEPWAPVGVGARLRATRQARCQRSGRQRRAFSGRRAVGRCLLNTLTEDTPGCHPPSAT
jgi:hypothetical protein